MYQHLPVIKLKNRCIGLIGSTCKVLSVNNFYIYEVA